MPPSKSGIADYSEALAGEMKKLTRLTVFQSAAGFQPNDYDVALYHLGNNPWHDFAYETALRQPGVVVMHEANLHHLIADLTIKRGDWDAYLAECELNGGAKALEYAKTRVRTLQTGPDYEGLAMTRRLLDASRGLVVHSEFVRGRCGSRGSPDRWRPFRTGRGFPGPTGMPRGTNWALTRRRRWWGRSAI